MREGKTGREVAEECGLSGEQRRDRTTTKGRNKQVKPDGRVWGGGMMERQRRGVDGDSERAQRRGC